MRWVYGSLPPFYLYIVIGLCGEDEVGHSHPTFGIEGIVKGDGCVVILTVVHPSCIFVFAYEAVSIELSDKILCCRSARRSACINVTDEKPFLLGGSASPASCLLSIGSPQ